VIVAVGEGWNPGFLKGT
ncbi:hypothetical protein K523DRAFT_31186, partial [Schizophyllum commune Tattone D]